jgi:hypothetical protein
VIDEFRGTYLIVRALLRDHQIIFVISFVLVALPETALCFARVLVIVFTTIIFSPLLEHPKCSPMFSILSAVTHDNSESAREIFSK